MKKTILLLLVLGWLWQGHAQFLEDFEGNFPPAGWTVINDGDTNGWTQYESADLAYSGNKFLYIYYSSDAHDDWLITPAITVDNSNHILSFYAANRDASYPDQFNVKLSTTGTNKADFTVMLDSAVTPPTEYTRYSYDLSAYNGQTVYVAIQATSADQFILFLDYVVNASIAPMEADYTVHPDCANNQYTVDIKLTDMGGSSSVTVADDQGNASQQLSDTTSTVTFGPYASGTEVHFTLTSDDDNIVVKNKTMIHFCPPDNDKCSGAQEISIANTCQNIIADIRGAITDTIPADPSCSSGHYHDIWYYITPASDIDTLYIETSSDGDDSDIDDTVLAVYTGDCNNLTEVACNDDANGTYFSSLSLTNVTAGTTYYIRVMSYYDVTEGTFNICAYAPNLSAHNEILANDFIFYPNPTNGSIYWNANGTVDRVQVINLAGQVLVNMDNPSSNRLDISRLDNGIYLLNVWMDGKKGVYRIIKK